MKFIVQTHNLDRLSAHDRAGVENAAQAKFATLSEWDANLSERFQYPCEHDRGSGWTVHRNENDVWLRHPYFLVVLEVMSYEFTG